MTWSIRAPVENGQTSFCGVWDRVVDMFHLHFYEDIYHKRHIPIHYVLLVGYDE